MPKANPPFSSDLSELEGGVLGIIHATPGQTAHQVREEFRRSRSSHWSGSAGAIYPLIKKLHSKGLLDAEEGPWGKGVRRTYTVSSAGKKELVRWIGPPLEEWMASVTYDPLRTRMPFIGSLSPARQAAFLAQAEEQLERELKVLRRARKELEDEAPFWDLMAAEGCLASTQARLRWIQRVREAHGSSETVR